MKNKIKFILDIFLSCLYKLYELRKVLVLILLIPLSEIKAIFYHVNIKIHAALFFGKKRWFCNVLEDYSNVIIFGVIMYYLYNEKPDKKVKETARFLFVLNALDLIHLGLLDMQYFVIAKLVLAYIIYFVWSKLKPSC